MKIVTISNYYPEHSGGIEFVALNLVKRWRMRHQVRWLACEVKDFPHAREPDDVPLPSSNFTETRLGFPYPVPTGKSFFRIFEEIKRCDVVHIHDCLYPASIVAFLASRWHQKPLLVTQHVSLVQYSQAYKNMLQKLAYGTLGKLVLENAEQIVFISQRVKTWFEERMHFSHETTLIPNGVDQSIFYPPTEDEQKTSRFQLGFSPDENICLFVGRFTEKKGLNLVRKIAQERPHFQWVLIGREELDPREWKLGNVQVIPPIPQPELRQYYIAADLFVLPSVGEGFPLAVQEALSCGLPTAVSQETANYIPDAPLIKLDIAALSTILKTMDGLFTNKKQLIDLKKATAQYARKWDWTNVAQQYEDIFSRIYLQHK